MTELENHTLQLLRKMDRSIQELRDDMNRNVQELRDRIDQNYKKHQTRLNGLQLALQGETFRDQCTVATFDKRISALERRDSRIRKPK
jgi:hypothetical protein